jgi:hypothetical protein
VTWELGEASEMGGDPPAVVERIVEPSYAVAPCLFSRLEDCLGSGAKRIPKDGVNVVDICEVNTGASGIVRARFTQHQH